MMSPMALEAVKQELAGVKEQWESNMKAMMDPVVAENEMLKKQIAELAGQVKGLSSNGQGKLVVPDGKYMGMDRVDLSLCKSLAEAADETGQGGWGDNVFRALTSTGAGTGAELTGEETAAALWNDVRLMNMVGPLFTEINMPTEPFNVPRQLGLLNFYPGTQNTAATATDPATGQAELASKELVAEVDWSYDLDEDSVVAMVPTVREAMVEGVARVLDDVLLNASTAMDADNINNDGEAYTSATEGLAQYTLGWYGLRHYSLRGDTSAQSNYGGAMSAERLRGHRAVMSKYGVLPSQLALVCGPDVYLRLLGLDTVTTLEKYGPNATVLTGELARVDGIPVVVSEFVKNAQDNGEVSATAGNNTTGQLVLVNRTQWLVGYRRRITIEVFRHIQQRQVVMVVSLRVAFVPRQTGEHHTVLGRNVTL